MQYFILMGDIVGSSEKPAATLMTSFRDIVTAANHRFRDQIVSPLTITLGDEFQGVVRDLHTAAQLMLFMDSTLVGVKNPFRIRYSLNYGAIDTPINKEEAHGMLGEGLTHARKALEAMKQHKQHYLLMTGKAITDELLNGLFELYDSIYSDWGEKDWGYLVKFFERDDYKWVSGQLSKDPSTVWRKRNSLKLKEYNIAKKLIQKVALEF